MGSITSAALVFLFSNNKLGPDGYPWTISSWALLLSIIFAEHLYLVVQTVVHYVLAKMDRPGLQKERAQRFAMRRQLLQETLGQDLTHGASLGGNEKITRQALEDEARLTSQGHGTPEEM
jgi:hypothetical protein